MLLALIDNCYVNNKNDYSKNVLTCHKRIVFQTVNILNIIKAA